MHLLGEGPSNLLVVTWVREFAANSETSNLYRLQIGRRDKRQSMKNEAPGRGRARMSWPTKKR